LVWFAVGVFPAQALRVELQEVASGFDFPLYITHAGDGSGRLFIVERAGVIRIIREGRTVEEPFLDLGKNGQDRVSRPAMEADERGLLGLAFHPRYRENRQFYVHYTRRTDGASIIAMYRASADHPDRADPDETVILGPVEQPQWNHNGGMVEFGPDGLLYVALGDGGFRDDRGKGHTPEIGNAQDTANLLGKILRIDVDRPEAPLAYGIPPDNPFAREGSSSSNRREIFAWGLRNVWRFSFDRATGRLFAGDVGQDRWEEINLIVASGNYGWRRMEGMHCFIPEEDCRRPDLLPPIHEYDHSEERGGLSVTGGYVYRGRAFPAFEGLYFFADYSTGRVWTLRETDDGGWEATEHLRLPFWIPTFGEDEAGELYLCNFFRGVIFRIVDADQENTPIFQR
jgi:glucose/arabinose dehydrogenase